MLKSIAKIFSDSNEKEVKRLQPLVAEVNGLEPEFEKLSDEELRAKTAEFKAAIADGYALEDLMAEAFAAVREASKRTLGQRHFDMQIVGGAVLHHGRIAEMKTGEGKTLVATLPAYLNALTGQGVHIVTVNDYLAKRDTQWMGAIYTRLGLTVACLQHDSSFQYDVTAESDDPRMKSLRAAQRKDAYQADITYGTNSEFGFDYLRDNMVVDLTQMVQRELNFGIVDEVDNILIDEARTPLIISGQSGESAQYYTAFAKLIPSLKNEEDYTIDEKVRTVSLTASGIAKLEQRLNIPNLYDSANYNLTHYVDNALKAHAVYKRDVDYVVKDAEVILVDEFTGRLMFGRRLSDGLHQAIEAKEGVKVQPETVTLATVTIQNYFRMYNKLAGMTGTAATEAEEFFKIYKLEVVAVPTNQAMIRKDENDLIYKTQAAKFNAAAEEIEEAYRQERPVLVGTVSIENSEVLSGLLTRKGVPHQVLNAKQHEREAAIVAEAGRVRAVTVATNMAGRGTDIILGGTRDGREEADWKAEHEKVVSLGGLYILGTERHEARRIDNQLRGRSGRQGDPGLSRFFISLEDDLMRRFGGDQIKRFMDWAGVEDDAPMQHGIISKSIQNAQQKVEGHNFDIRKRLIDYDDVVNKHREVIYGERHKIMEGADLKANVQELVHKELDLVFNQHCAADDLGQWDVEGLFAALKAFFPLPKNLTEEAFRQLSRDEAAETLSTYADDFYAELETAVTPDIMRVLERMVMLRVIDTHWVEHLTHMENMRQGIGLQGVAQIDPLVAYKREGHTMFNELSSRIQNSIARSIYHSAIGQNQQTVLQQQRAPQFPPPPSQGQAQPGRGVEANGAGATVAPPLAASPPARQPKLAAPVMAPSKEQKAMAMAVGDRGAGKAQPAKLGRNDLCFCGSGKKYKKCHGA